MGNKWNSRPRIDVTIFTVHNLRIRVSSHLLALGVIQFLPAGLGIAQIAIQFLHSTLCPFLRLPARSHFTVRNWLLTSERHLCTRFMNAFLQRWTILPFWNAFIWFPASWRALFEINCSLLSFFLIRLIALFFWAVHRSAHYLCENGAHLRQAARCKVERSSDVRSLFAHKNQKKP